MILIENLSKTFVAGGQRIEAVNDVSLQVRAGEVFGLLGPNGAGKTTVMRLILGLLKPDAGSASVNGFPIETDPDEVKRNVGFVSATAAPLGVTGQVRLKF